MLCPLKIDTDGKYCDFPGVTIISSIKKEDLKKWTSVYQSLSESNLVRDFFSPLPAASYHMTLRSMYTQLDDALLNWEDFITEKLPEFQKVAQDLKQNAFTPELQIIDVSVSSVIQIVLEVSPAQQKMMRNFRKNIEQPKSYHITLGYQFYRFPNQQQKQEIRNLVVKSLQEVFPTLAIHLNPPRLCYYRNMTNFIEWNGGSNPFRGRKLFLETSLFRIRGLRLCEFFSECKTELKQ